MSKDELNDELAELAKRIPRRLRPGVQPGSEATWQWAVGVLLRAVNALRDALGTTSGDAEPSLGEDRAFLEGAVAAAKEEQERIVTMLRALVGAPALGQTADEMVSRLREELNRLRTLARANDETAGGRPKPAESGRPPGDWTLATAREAWARLGVDQPTEWDGDQAVEDEHARLLVEVRAWAMAAQEILRGTDPCTPEGLRHAGRARVQELAELRVSHNRWASATWNVLPGDPVQTPEELTLRCADMLRSSRQLTEALARAQSDGGEARRRRDALWVAVQPHVLPGVTEPEEIARSLAARSAEVAETMASLIRERDALQRRLDAANAALHGGPA